MKEGMKIAVTQIKGLSGRPERARKTIAALGLGKIGKTREFTANEAVWGMLRRVRHLVEVVEVK